MTDSKWKGGKPDAPSPWKKMVERPTRAAIAESGNGDQRRRKPVVEARPSRPAAPTAPQRAAAPTASPRASEEPRIVRPSGELRLYGVNACLAAFGARPGDLRKVYLTEARIAALKPVLAWCVKNKLGYRVVETGDLDKLSGSKHHEGVCFEMLRRPPLELATLLGEQPSREAPSLLLWLDGVGNPHNLGAVLRSAAHFGASGIIVPRTSALDLSGAAARVAEGGAESVPLVRTDDERAALDMLRAAGYAIAASVPRDGADVFTADLPARLVLVFGAESEGMSTALIAAADLRLTIPGSGAVESLNIAVSAAVFLAEYRRRHAWIA